ncbi:phosphorylase b kinase regulatory subunit beta-like [Dysidea avara]|uniref:phosphorylase b kinase regulatory subunit beta-like n=1 Tax=Dysidea avara TaxID=196820 RepID=UPI00332FE574
MPQRSVFGLSDEPDDDRRTRKEVLTHSQLLDRYYNEVSHSILTHQTSTLGLFPRGTSGHARVRDNVYCAMALWSLALAYRHIGDDKGRTYELEQSAVKCLRGILYCYMRQASKVEQFKLSWLEEDALHSRFDPFTGDPVTDDTSWGHLQIDATSLYLLTVAQVTVSGVKVVMTMDEVNFIQNLIYYVERAYRTPDFGMWERGTKENVGKRELHASSIGMALAAMEAMNNLNLFGDEGTSSSVIHVDPDAHYRNRIILSTLLPRESTSKETDASLLSITGFPAFAIPNKDMKETVTKNVIEILEGSHGLKRFIRDGHHTVKEDRSQRFYDASSGLRHFEDIECEWPMFYVSLVLNAMFSSHQERTEEYWAKLQKSVVSEEQCEVVPKFYFIPGSSNSVASSSSTPDHQPKLPASDKQPFLWSQALYIIARLLRDNLVTVYELDPLNRHLSPLGSYAGPSTYIASASSTIVQIVLIAETPRLQTILATHGIPTQTTKQVEPVEVRPPSELTKMLRNLGANEKLGLTGRPSRPYGMLGTTRLYRFSSKIYAFFPAYTDVSDFYLSHDVSLFIDVMRLELRFLQNWWDLKQRPTLTLLLREDLFKGSHFLKMMEFLSELKRGECEGVKVRLDRLQVFISTSCIEHLDHISDDADESRDHSVSSRMSVLSTLTDFSGPHLLEDDPFVPDQLTTVPTHSYIKHSTEILTPTYSPDELEEMPTERLHYLFNKEFSVLGQLQILHTLVKRDGKHTEFLGVPLVDKVKALYDEAGHRKDWAALRMASSILEKVVEGLSPAMSAMLVKEKEVTIGPFRCEEFVIGEPVHPNVIKRNIYEKCMIHDPIEVSLQQEMIIYLGSLIVSDPQLFNGMLRIRLGWIIEAIKNDLTQSSSDTLLMNIAPHEVKQCTINILDRSRRQQLKPLQRRQLDGALNWVPPGFYSKVHRILQMIEGGIKLYDYLLPQLPTIYDMHPQEKSFALKVEEMLKTTVVPEDRQLIVELLMVISAVVERNPEIKYKHCLDLVQLLEYAKKLHHDSRKDKKDDDSAKEHIDGRNVCYLGSSFHALPPTGHNSSSAFMTMAVVNTLLQGELDTDSTDFCSVG